MNRLLITGGSGYLGSRLLQLADQSSAWETHTTFFENPIPHPRAHRLDLRDRAATEALIATVRPDVIIHQAVSPRNDEHIAAIVPSARHIMDAAIANHIRLVHVSTDMVFDGENAPYDDDAAPAPLTPYAAAKAEVEALLASVTSDMPDCLIVRPSLIYGFDPIDKQTGWLVDGLKRGDTVRLFTDEIRCPIWVDTAALALLELADSSHSGRLNLVGSPLNRWDFGMLLLNYLRLDPTPNVIPSTVAQSGLKRPRNLTLSNAKAKRWLKTPLLSVEEVGKQLGLA